MALKVSASSGDGHGRQPLRDAATNDASAKALVVYRSTLKSRLQRIRELSGHDVNDPDSRFNLQLATRAWATLRALRS
jgi:hypothetical protein